MRKKTYLRLAEYQTEQSEKHLNEVRSIHKEMRGYKHDFHNHLQTLRGQLEAGEVGRALAYIDRLDNQLMHVDTLLKTGNVSLDAILSAKIAQAKEEQIAVSVKANVPDLLTISDLELSIIVGNLLDNAIEACRAVMGERFIRIFISMKGNMLYFSMLKHSGLQKEKDRLPIRDAQGRGSRFRSAPRRGDPRGTRRLGEIQQRGGRIYLGISGACEKCLRACSSCTDKRNSCTNLISLSFFWYIEKERS